MNSLHLLDADDTDSLCENADDTDSLCENVDDDGFFYILPFSFFQNDRRQILV